MVDAELNKFSIVFISLGISYFADFASQASFMLRLHFLLKNTSIYTNFT